MNDAPLPYSPLPLSELAQGFPSLMAAPGVLPWDPALFVRWLCSHALRPEALHAGRFLLSLVNGGDWARMADVEGLNLPPLLRQPFALLEASRRWDRQHLVAFLSWWDPAPSASTLRVDELEQPLVAVHGEQGVVVETPHAELEGPRWLVEGWQSHVDPLRSQWRPWPSDRQQAMEELALSFHVLDGAPGLRPWDCSALLRELCTPGLDEAAVLAGHFLLDVWNPGGDWHAVAQEEGYRWPCPTSRFDARAARRRWDTLQRCALSSYLMSPFCP